jgi:hypothetical protein
MFGLVIFPFIVLSAVMMLASDEIPFFLTFLVSTSLPSPQVLVLEAEEAAPRALHPGPSGECSRVHWW